MVDPKDIRPGNMVLRVTGKDVNGKSFFEYTPVAIDEYYFTWAKYCFPIKLTPDLLSKCGFVFNKNVWYINPPNFTSKDNIPFLSWNPGDGWFLKEFRLLYQPVYLHKLQNLYYNLTGNELVIDPMLFQNIDIIGPINFAGKLISKAPARPLL
jgi:hypothetical protein